VVGSIDKITVTHASRIDDADENSIVWLKPGKANSAEIIAATLAKVIICAYDDAVHESSKTFICVDEPKLIFTRVVQHFFVEKPVWGIHPSAVIHPEAELAKDVFVGPLTYIGKSKVGSGSVIYGSCHIYDHVSIGRNVRIHAGTVIGADGFGYARNRQNEFEQFPHIGGVVIEDNVDIGSNTSIDRGALGNTLIKTGAKIDNLVHIAHNVVVGAHAAVIANAMVGGSAVIADYAWVAPSASIMNQARMGKNSTLGMGAVLTKDMPEDEVWTGSPARPLEQFLKMQNKLKNL
jgi:UDP-3-O-[3-hydroxymyristoyl] glucosamine N-acyltransferase